MTSLSCILQPVFDVFELRHGNGVDHGDLAVVIFEDENHVEVLELK